MTHVVDIEGLRADGWLDERQAREIVRRSRAAMVGLAINSVLIAGILLATTGLVFWLSDALAVAVAGSAFLAVGLFFLSKAKPDFRMFGNAASVLGAGMLLGGLAIEMMRAHVELADPVLIVTGAAVGGLSALGVHKGPPNARFAAGTILLMGVALHLYGLGNAMAGLPAGLRAPLFLYAAALIAAAGVFLDVRLVTAFAILPLTGMLGVKDGHVEFGFLFSLTEETLTILMMAGVAALSLFVSPGRAPRERRHALTLAMLALITVNLCFLLGSWLGDGVGQLFLERPVWDDALGLEVNREALRTYGRGLFFIPEEMFIVTWTVVLVATAFWAGRRSQRGVFNTAIVFGAIHLATQVLEDRWDEPAAWALIGLALIPLAWSMWRVNQVLEQRTPTPS